MWNSSGVLSQQWVYTDVDQLFENNMWQRRLDTFGRSVEDLWGDSRKLVSQEMIDIRSKKVFTKWYQVELLVLCKSFRCTRYILCGTVN